MHKEKNQEINLLEKRKKKEEKRFAYPYGFGFPYDGLVLALQCRNWTYS